MAGRALRLVTDWALEGLGLERVELRIDVANEPSIRVAERAGYRRDGVLRSLHVKEDVRGDVAVYSLLADERPLTAEGAARSVHAGHAKPPPLGGG